MPNKQKRTQNTKPALDANGNGSEDKGPDPKRQEQTPGEPARVLDSHDACDLFNRLEKSIKKYMENITKLEAAEPPSREDSNSKKLKYAKYHLRKRLKDGVQEFLTSRSRNAADEGQRKAAFDLLNAAQEASQRRRHRFKIVDTATFEEQLAILENRKAERLLLSADLLEGSEDWTRRDYIRKNWNELFSGKEDKIRTQLKDTDEISENEKMEFEKRLDRCFKFSPQEQRIMDDCRTLKQRASKNISSESGRMELLSTEKRGKTLKQVIEEVRAEWKDCFNPNLDLERGKTTAKEDSDAHELESDNKHDQYDGGLGTYTDGGPEEDIEKAHAGSGADFFVDLDDEEWKFMRPLVEYIMKGKGILD